MTTPPNPAFQVTVLTDLFSEYNNGKDRIVQQLEDDGQRHMDWLIEATKVQRKRIFESVGLSDPTLVDGVNDDTNDNSSSGSPCKKLKTCCPEEDKENESPEGSSGSISRDGFGVKCKTTSNSKLEVISEKPDYDVSIMKVTELRSELRKRQLDTKGLKRELQARLEKALQEEAEDKDGMDVDEDGFESCEEEEQAIMAKASETERAEQDQARTSPDSTAKKIERSIVDLTNLQVDNPGDTSIANNTNVDNDDVEMVEAAKPEEKEDKQLKSKPEPETESTNPVNMFFKATSKLFSPKAKQIHANTKSTSASTPTEPLATSTSATSNNDDSSTIATNSTKGSSNNSSSQTTTTTTSSSSSSVATYKASMAEKAAARKAKLAEMRDKSKAKVAEAKEKSAKHNTHRTGGNYHQNHNIKPKSTTYVPLSSSKSTAKQNKLLQEQEQETKKQRMREEMRLKAAQATKHLTDVENKDKKHIISTSTTTSTTATASSTTAALSQVKGTPVQPTTIKPQNKAVLSPMDTYEISDREGSDSSDSDDSDDENNQNAQQKRIPKWARSVNLNPALKKQFLSENRIDPEEIFHDVTTCDLEQIFNRKKDRYKKRTSSGNWTNDKVTAQEILVYKRQMGFDKKTRK